VTRVKAPFSGRISLFKESFFKECRDFGTSLGRFLGDGHTPAPDIRVLSTWKLSQSKSQSLRAGESYINGFRSRMDGEEKVVESPGRRQLTCPLLEKREKWGTPSCFSTGFQ